MPIYKPNGGYRVRSANPHLATGELGGYHPIDYDKLIGIFRGWANPRGATVKDGTQGAALCVGCGGVGSNKTWGDPLSDQEKTNAAVGFFLAGFGPAIAVGVAPAVPAVVNAAGEASLAYELGIPLGSSSAITSAVAGTASLITTGAVLTRVSEAAAPKVVVYARTAENQGLSWVEQSGILRAAARGKGNFGIGSASADDANALGRIWVGEDFTTASDGRILISKDGLRQYRPPSYKPSVGGYQADFERRFPGQLSSGWSDGHLDIWDLP
jgi:hypothetical protein